MSPLNYTPSSHHLCNKLSHRIEKNVSLEKKGISLSGFIDSIPGTVRVVSSEEKSDVDPIAQLLG